MIDKVELVKIAVQEDEKTSNQNIEILKQLDKEMDNAVKYLNRIQENIKLAQQRRDELIRQGYQFYLNDIQYKNQIILGHNSSLSYANNRGIQFWKSQTDSNIYYRINKYGKRKKLNSPNELYSVLGAHVHMYDTLDKVQLFDLNTNVLLLVSEWFTKIEGDMFDPFNALEWTIYNNLQYRNTFQYTSYLQKRNIPQQINQIRININQQFTDNFISLTPMQSQQPQLFYINPSVSDDITFYMGDHLQNLESQLVVQESPIQKFIQLFSKDDEQFYYII